MKLLNFNESGIHDRVQIIGFHYLFLRKVIEQRSAKGKHGLIAPNIYIRTSSIYSL